MEGNNSGLGSAKKASRGWWTMAQKQQAVAESNVNVADVAKQHGVRPALLSSWRRQLLSKATVAKKPVKFAAVCVGATPFDGMIEIDLTGGCVRVCGIVDAGMLREVLVAAR